MSYTRLGIHKTMRAIDSIVCFVFLFIVNKWFPSRYLDIVSFIKPSRVYSLEMYLPLKTESFAKLFFIISCTGLLLYVLLAIYTFHTAFTTMFRLQDYQEYVQGLPNPDERVRNKYKELRYILLWVNVNSSLNLVGEGQDPFVDHKCSHTNCYLTSNKYLINDDYINFDAIIFDVNDLHTWQKMNFPETRLLHQKYIFYSSNSSDNVPICNFNADNYFNWTWTYRLDSDIVSPFIEVKDIKGNVVAPKSSVKWETELRNFTDDEIKLLKGKKKAVAWFVTKCKTRNDRLRFAKMLRAVLKENSLVFDIYGCGHIKCPNGECSEVVKDYYFYFAAEDSNAEDYVTQEVITAYDNYAVPIVLGGANYNRFLPTGSYINIANYSIDKLVAVLDYIIQNPKIYYDFHRWRKHYIINKAEKFKGICEVCEYLNDERKFGTVSVKEDFRKWWYSGVIPLLKRCIPKREVLTF